MNANNNTCDPNALLYGIRTSLMVIAATNTRPLDQLELDELNAWSDAVDDLEARMRALDEWLTRGGSLPDAWRGGAS